MINTAVMAAGVFLSSPMQSTSCLELVPCTTKSFTRSDSWTNTPWVGADVFSSRHVDRKILAGQLNVAVVNSPSLSAESQRRGLLDQEVECMQKQGSAISTDAFFRLLQKCIDEKNLGAGREVHSKIVKTGLESDSFLGSHLIRMFAFFEDLWEANQVFSNISEPSVFAWNAIISAHAKLGQYGQAIQLYGQMRDLAVEPNGHVFVAVLQACASAAALIQGKLIHGHIVESGLSSHLFVGNSLIDMYGKCGDLQDACIMFNRLPDRDVVSWNAMIVAYGHHGYLQESFWLLQMMSEQGIEPNRVTFLCFLKACSSHAALAQGKQIHMYVIEHWSELDKQVADTLIDMYVTCGSLHDAQAVFDQLRGQSFEAWNSMIAACIQLGNSNEALRLFQEMQHEGFVPKIGTFVCILQACSMMTALEQGKQVHYKIIECGFDSDIFVGNTLIDFYGKCRSFDDACLIFDRLPSRDVVTWSALIAGYAQHGYCKEALEFFQKMQQEGISPNQVTFVCVLKACSILAVLELGKQIHNHIICSGFQLDIFVGSALVDMYAKCGSVEDARLVFFKLPERDTVTWSAMVAGYAQHGHGQEALEVFQQMQEESIEPSIITFVGILKGCSSIAALEHGKEIHTCIIKRGFEADLFVGSILIDFYAKCGCLQDAWAVFNSLPRQDVVTWSAMIAGFAQHSNYKLASQFFEDMQQEGLSPNEVTFLSLLSACNHVGEVDEGCQHFRSMRKDHGIMPALEHYYSMVDLLGQAGHSDEAEDLLESIPFQQNIVGWTSLLGSCKAHGNVYLGRRCFEHVVRIDPGYATGYLLMSDIYAQAGMWQDAEKVEELRRSANAWKKPAKAFIEVDNEVHGFIVDDKTHPQSDDIYAKLRSLSVQIRDQGYMPHTDLVLSAASEGDKEDGLCGHSEKLAIAFGLISTPRGTTIRLAKNLRVCVDCHLAAKIISKIEMREIIIADSYCIHHFKEGTCSCNDRP